MKIWEKARDSLTPGLQILKTHRKTQLRRESAILGLPLQVISGYREKPPISSWSSGLSYGTQVAADLTQTSTEVYGQVTYLGIPKSSFIPYSVTQHFMKATIK